MNIGTHGGSCGHSCCLRIQNLSVRVGNHDIISNINSNSKHSHEKYYIYNSITTIYDIINTSYL